MAETNTGSGSDSRAPGFILVGAFMIMVAGAATGSLAPSLRDAPWSDDPQQLADAIAGNPGAWVWANGLFLAAAIVTALGLGWFSLRFEGDSRPWALMGLITFGIAAAIQAINRIISMTVYAWAAQQLLDINEVTIQSFIQFDTGLGAAFRSLGFLAVALYGIALLRRAPANRLGWLFVAGAAFGILLVLIGAAIPAFIYVGTAALGVAGWLPVGDA